MVSRGEWSLNGMGTGDYKNEAFEVGHEGWGKFQLAALVIGRFSYAGRGIGKDIEMLIG